MFMIIEKQNYVKIFDKIFILSLLSFLFGFLILWCYRNFTSKNYMLLLLSIPFWIIGIVLIKKYLFKTNKISNTSIPKIRFNFNIIVSFFLVIVAFLAGISMLFFGIRDTYNLNKETKKYITTTGYFYHYDIYKSDKHGTTYKLTYIYVVDDQEYSITTDYGTNYIPNENSIREVKYNPDNPEKAVLIGTNNKNILIFIGAFFVLLSLTFVLVALSISGYFDKFKFDIIGTYIGAIFLIIGIGIMLFQNGTTMSLIETIKSLSFWILIPLIFIVVGIFQIVNCLFFKRNKLYSKKVK